MNFYTHTSKKHTSTLFHVLRLKIGIYQKWTIQDSLCEPIEYIERLLSELKHNVPGSPSYLEFSQVGLVVKNLPAMQQTKETWVIPGSGRSPRGGTSNPIQFSCLENPMEEPGGLRSMGLQRVRHNWSGLAHGNRGLKEVQFCFYWPAVQASTWKQYLLAIQTINWKAVVLLIWTHAKHPLKNKLTYQCQYFLLTHKTKPLNS